MRRRFLLQGQQKDKLQPLDTDEDAGKCQGREEEDTYLTERIYISSTPPESKIVAVSRIVMRRKTTAPKSQFRCLIWIHI